MKYLTYKTEVPGRLWMTPMEWKQRFFANKPTEQTVVVQIWFAKHDRMYQKNIESFDVKENDNISITMGCAEFILNRIGKLANIL